LLPSHGICIRNWESLWVSLAVELVNLINVPLLCIPALSCCLRHQAVCSSTHLLHSHFPGEHLLFRNILFTKHRTDKHYYDFKLRVDMIVHYLMFMRPCIVDIVKVKIRLDAIKYAVLLPQHVSGTNMPITRSTISEYLPLLGGHTWKWYAK
jgi:hypothetical protein